MSEDNNIVVNNAELSAENTSETYSRIRNSVITAQSRIYNAVNTAMVQAYWEIGEQIYIACGENDRAEYGKGLLKYLSEKLTSEFGAGFAVRNLQMMRKFYLMYQNANTLCSQLSWSHYRILMRISDDKRREWYTEECAKSGWSVRQLERQINTISMSVCFQARKRTLLLLKFRQQNQNLNMKRLSVTLMYLNFLTFLKILTFMKRSWNRLLLTTCRNSFLSSAEASAL